MTLIRTFMLAVLLLAGAVVTFAQSEQASKRNAPPDPTVTVSVSAKGVRFAALGSIGHMRLEVFNSNGDLSYNSEFQPGNVRDWALEDKLGQRLPDGSYLCLVSVRDLSGRLGMKQGTVLVQDGQGVLKLGDGGQVAALEPEKLLAPISDGYATAVTLMAHDGRDGQVISTVGGLTFRAGDFFAGRDKELMRLTAQGNLGVGVNQPTAKLDVAGLIRTAEGIVFPDGTIQSTAANISGSGARDSVSPNRGSSFTAESKKKGTGGDQSLPQLAVNISGAGTTNQVSKFTDGPGGVIGDSLIAEAGGNVAIGGPVVAGVNLDFRQTNASDDILQRIWNQFGDLTPRPLAGTKLRYVSAVGGTSQLQLTDNAEWLMAIAGNSTIGMQFRVRNTNETNTEAGLAAAAKMTILRNGNVGIGTTSPQVKLDVAGDFLVSGNAVITGNIAAKYQDVAEWVPAVEELVAGTVVSLDRTRSNTVVSSTRAYDTRIAGVVSSQPGVILGEGGAGKVLVATTGRVKVKVDATRHPIAIGDLLVTSDRSGVAMKSIPIKVGASQIHRPGTIIGKALEPLANGKGEILVLLSLQ